jgi:hypothetical protein
MYNIHSLGVKVLKLRGFILLKPEEGKTLI